MTLDVSHAEQVLHDHATDTLLHNQQVGKIMRYFAQQLGEDEQKWYITGLLHDVDRDHISKNADKHLKDEFVEIINKLPYSDEVRTELIQDIRSHGPYLTWVEPSTRIQQYLISIDELSGLMYAYARMRGAQNGVLTDSSAGGMRNGFDGMETKGVIKRIKDKAFAAGVDREHVKNCEHYLNIPLEEFVEQMIKAYQSF